MSIHAPILKGKSSRMVVLVPIESVSWFKQANKLNNTREEALVEFALVEFEDRVDVAHRYEVLEYHLVRADAYNWTVFLKKAVIGFALLEAGDMCGDPEIRYHSIPRTGYYAEG
jgi:hypothetical protein